MKAINDYYIIEFGDTVEKVKYLLNLGCNVYVYLEHYGHMYRLVYKNLDYITASLYWVLSNVTRDYEYDDNRWLDMIKTAGSLFIDENN